MSTELWRSAARAIPRSAPLVMEHVGWVLRSHGSRAMSPPGNPETRHEPVCLLPLLPGSKASGHCWRPGAVSWVFRRRNPNPCLGGRSLAPSAAPELTSLFLSRFLGGTAS